MTRTLCPAASFTKAESEWVSDDVDEIGLLAPQHFFGMIVDRQNAKPRGKAFPLGAISIADGHSLHASELLAGGELKKRPENLLRTWGIERLPSAFPFLEGAR